MRLSKPEGFSPVLRPSGIILLEGRPEFIRPGRKAEGARARGVQYEKKVRRVFEELLGKSYCHGQWFEFLERGGKRWCQTDGIWLDRERKILTIFEIKYRHMVKAWWQLRRLYSPILWAYLQELGEREFKVAICEVVKIFDPLEEFPEKVYLVDEVGEIEPGRFNVLRLDPGREYLPRVRRGPGKVLSSSSSEGVLV